MIDGSELRMGGALQRTRSKSVLRYPSPNLPGGTDGNESNYDTWVHDDWSSGFNPNLPSAKQE